MSRRARGRHAAPPPRTLPRLPAAGAFLAALAAASLGVLGLLPAGSSTAPAAVAAAVAVAPPTAVRDDLSRASRSRVVLARPVVRPAASPTTPPEPVDPLPGCRLGATAATGYDNGRIPLFALCALPGHPGHALRADAARAFAALDLAYAARFGERLCVTDSYRSLTSQRVLARSKPGLAARPGTSEHGLGMAVDLACGVDGYRTDQHRWLAAHAGRFGWGQPAWARDGGRREEPWHWELLAR